MYGNGQGMFEITESDQAQAFEHVAVVIEQIVAVLLISSTLNFELCTNFQ
jgi:hypothetical protein